MSDARDVARREKGESNDVDGSLFPGECDPKCSVEKTHFVDASVSPLMPEEKVVDEKLNSEMLCSPREANVENSEPSINSLVNVDAEQKCDLDGQGKGTSFSIEASIKPEIENDENEQAKKSEKGTVSALDVTSNDTSLLFSSGTEGHCNRTDETGSQEIYQKPQAELTVNQPKTTDLPPSDSAQLSTSYCIVQPADTVQFSENKAEQPAAEQPYLIENGLLAWAADKWNDLSTWILTNVLKPREMTLIIRDCLIQRAVAEDGSQVECFQFVMSVFHNYEKENLNQDVSTVFRFLNDYIRDVERFVQDFPLLIVIAYRTRYQFTSKYKCKSSYQDTYAKACCKQLETVMDRIQSDLLVDNHSVISLLKTLDTFLEKDFEFYMDFKRSSELVSAFTFFRKSLEKFYRKKKDQKSLCTFFQHFMWVCLIKKAVFAELKSDIKTDMQLDATASTGVGDWLNAIKESVCQQIEYEDMKSLRLLLQRVNLLHGQPGLSSQLSTFGISELSAFIMPALSDGRLCTLRFALMEFHILFPALESLLSYVSEVCDCYNKLLSAKKTLNPIIAKSQGGPLNVLKEGLLFADSVMVVITDREWRQQEDKYSKWFKAWIDVLLKVVDFEHQHQLVDCLKALFAHQKYQVTCVGFLKPYIEDQVLQMTKNTLPHLGVQQFTALYESLEIWPKKLVDEYLEVLAPQQVSLEGTVWKSFFSGVAKRVKGASGQQILTRFLIQMGNKHNDSQCVNYLINLLRLNVPELLDIQQKNGKLNEDDDKAVQAFKVDLKRLIEIKCKRDQLRRRIKDITTAIGTHIETCLQVVLIEVIADAMVPRDEGFGNSVEQALNFAQASLSDGKLGWVYKDPTGQEQFLLRFLNGVCEKCHLPSLSSSEYCQTLTNLHKMTVLYSNVAEKTSMKKSFGYYLPEIFKKNQLAESYFTWIGSVQDKLLQFQTLFDKHDLDYEELIAFETSSNLMMQVARRVNTETEMILESERRECYKINFQVNLGVLHSLLIKRPASDSGRNNWYTLSDVLEDYGIQLPTGIKKKIAECTSFPCKQEDNSWDKPEHHLQSIPSKNPEKSSLHNNFCLRLFKLVTLKTLENLIKDIEDFLQPIKLYIDALVHFKLYPSYLFTSYRQYVSAHHAERESNIEDVLSETKELVLKVLDGTATYAQITANGNVILETLEIEDELHGLLLFVSKKVEDVGDGVVALECFLKLFNFSETLGNISSVCEKFGLTNCKQNPEVIQLETIHKAITSDAQRVSLTTTKGKELWEEVKKCLQIVFLSESTFKIRILFVKALENTDFFHFLKEHGYLDQNGEQYFREQIQFISAHLQQEEYDDTVINHLLAAYNYICVFADSQQSFSTLLKTVADLELDAKDELPQFDTVRHNMHLIQFWFSKAGDTLDNVAHQLDSIMKSGVYYMNIGQYSSVELEFTCMVAKQVHMPNQSAGGCLGTVHHTPVEQRWKEEKIVDFVQRLGFYDTTKKCQSGLIKKFFTINETAHALFGLYLKLRELGHKCYTSTSVKLKCTDNIDWEDVIKTEQEVVHNWTEKVQELQKNYKWLLYFSIPKIMLLYDKLCQAKENSCYEEVCKQVDFLFPATSAYNVIKIVKKALWSLDQRTDIEPMEIVGSFLDQLLNSFSRTLHSSEQISSLSLHHLQHYLHFAPKFTEDDLTLLILRVFQLPPKPYCILHCNSSTTEQQLRRFTERIMQHPNQHYMLLETNKLPFHLQEILVQLYLNIKKCSHSSVHFVETSPTALQEIPWLTVYKEEVKKTKSLKDKLREQFKNQSGIGSLCVQIVHGLPGDGKSHYIRSQVLTHQVPSANVVYISINESFTYVNAIDKLCSLPYCISEEQKCAVIFNFTLHTYNTNPLMTSLGWFFFHLLILGYVEDPITGKSFHMSKHKSLLIYIEVPAGHTTTSLASESYLEANLQLFLEKIPTLRMLGTVICVDSRIPFEVDNKVQLVCKYLKAYVENTIDKLYKEPQRTKKKLSTHQRSSEVKFSTEADLSGTNCQELLQKFVPTHMNRKMLQKLFVQYMYRRCAFLDCLPGYNYNEGKVVYYDDHYGESKTIDTRKLGSTLMRAMLKEASNLNTLCWSDQPHMQLVYEFKDGGNSFHLISRYPDAIPKDVRQTYLHIGATIPTAGQLHTRHFLHQYISAALNIQLDENGTLKSIIDSNYVLTLDYTLKILNIHERYECEVPVIIEGETGVGKTAIVEMLSKLWNEAWLRQWTLVKVPIFDAIKQKLSFLSDKPSDDCGEYERCSMVVDQLYSGVPVKQMDVEFLLNYIESNLSKSHPQILLTECIRDYLLSLKDHPILSLIHFRSTNREQLADVFRRVDENSGTKIAAVAQLLCLVSEGKVQTLFYKKCIHSALTLLELENFFNPIFHQAEELLTIYSASSCDKRAQFSMQVPHIIIYLDEINTSSCGGLIKEIITDKSIDGKPIPENIFVVASCNPHRGDSLVTHARDNSWLKTTYYVQKLHPTLQYFILDYEALDEDQERQYINAKLEMLNESIKEDIKNSPELAELILKSQQKMREYGVEHLIKLGYARNVAEKHARSTVSQRDIQRVFTFYCWLLKLYRKCEQRNLVNKGDQQRRAVMVALGIVYYMRLNEVFRQRYKKYVDEQIVSAEGDLSFKDAIDEELDWFIKNVNPPPGIAKTRALKENVFAIIACTVTRTPLIVVGDPGSSKTLSFHLVVSKVKGKEADTKSVFRDTDIFQALDPHFYQCSRRTTSTEVEKVFTRAISRQKTFSGISLKMMCVVFMDEAGLPEEQFESLKVLHQYLDQPKVSFVAISNDILDAAKTNRAVSLFRPMACDDELMELAKCAIVTEQRKPSLLEENIIKALCISYKSTLTLDSTMTKMFGLRDFMYFVAYLHRNRSAQDGMTSQLVLQSLERNFNGSERFDDICDIFFGNIAAIRDDIPDIQHLLLHRNIVKVLTDSLKDCPLNSDGTYNEVRYKLIIDSSSDDSLTRMLFKYGVFDKEKTRMYMCSDFQADSHLQVNVISQIRHSAAAGHTVVMFQTDSIHESFYDLFNLRFRTLKDPKHQVSFFTNMAIGAHSKPCKVNPEFQCVVVIRQSELKHTPAPFLNRFEKYFISYNLLLTSVMENLPQCLQTVLMAAYDKVLEFIKLVSQEKGSLYGVNEETLDSLFLTILPPSGHKLQPVQAKHESDWVGSDSRLVLLHTLVTALRESAGFQIPKFTIEELSEDFESIFELICLSKTFDVQLEALRDKPELTTSLVDEAFEILYNSQHPSALVFELYRDSCLIIALLLQWLILFLVRRLLNLMTPEGLMTNCMNLPRNYIAYYLCAQNHFSLKDLLEVSVEKLQKNPMHCPSKLLCSTRSSQLIRFLPPEFPLKVTVDQPLSNSFVQSHIFHDTEKLILYKVSSQSSQSTIEELLDRYVTSENSVLIFIADSADVTQKMINHIRIMIELTESRSRKRDKLFVVLLHFPAVAFYVDCYSSVYLDGWEHYYLDTITHGSVTQDLKDVKTIVDIQEWYKCCLATPVAQMPDNNTINVDVMIEESMPIIVSRINFCSESELLMLMREEGFGFALATMFMRYWNSRAKLMELKRLTRHTCKLKSTLNVTDSLQINVRSYFINFVVYMVNLISDELKAILTKADVEFSEVCHKLLKVMPVPRLSQLRDFNIIDHSLHFNIPVDNNNYAASPKLPLSKHIAKFMEDLIDECRENVYQHTGVSSQHNIQEQSLFLSQAKQPIHMLYCEAVREKLEKHKDTKAFICRATALMKETPRYWDLYFNDFVLQKLGLSQESPRQSITDQLLHAYLQPVYDIQENDYLTRLIALHVLFRVNQIDLERLAKVLTHINTLVSLESSYSAPIVQSVHSTPIHALNRDIVCDVASIVCNTLYDSIRKGLTTVTSKWCDCYQAIIYEPLANEELMTVGNVLRAKLTILHATYLVMRSTRNPKCASSTFQQLNEICFIEVTSFTKFPCLELVATIGFNVLNSADEGDTSPDCCAFQHFMHGLFGFYFSEHHNEYGLDDRTWFLQAANQQTAFSLHAPELSKLATPFLSTGDPKGMPHYSIIGTLCVFKFFLRRLLQIDDCKNLPLQFNSQVLDLIDKTLTNSSEVVEHCPQYIPIFYQKDTTLNVSVPNGLNQPLAHLYFHCVLEHILDLHSQKSSQIMFTRLIRFATATENSNKPHQLIEKQAMIQALIQIISERFNPQHPGKLSAIFTGKGHHGGINQLLSDQRMGGSSSNVSGHGLVLAMHLHRQFGNASTLIQALIDSSSTLVNDVHCVKPLQQLCNRMPKDNAHLIFPPPTRKHGQARILELYQNIWTVLAARELSDEADEGHDNAVQELVDLTKQCCESAETVDFFGTKISLKGAFQMLLWLCIYHNFYDKQKQSSSLANVIGTHLNKLLDCRLCALYRSFVDPSHMIDHPEDPGLDENALQCIHSEDLRFIPLQREEKTCDPILQFFYPLSSPRRDSLDNYNCHGIANLVAAVLACPPRSNHLWYLMFEADELEQTYMSGFMYNKAINNGEGLYDSGIELTSDGQYGRPDYIPRVTRGTLSLHSLYHVLWSNFAALCIGLATQPDAHEKIHGRVISKVQPIRHYCSTQLRTMWLHMTNNMDMTSEEHTFFITRSMTNIIKCFGVRDEHFGRLDTLKQLDHYESLWHTNVFLPSLKDLPEQLAQHCNFSHNALMQKTRELARFYPQFPTLHNFTQRMLSSIDVARNFPLLWKFLIAYPRLQAGGAVLPELIVFYKWVHTVLPYTCPMSLDYARESTFEKIVTDRKLSRLYCRVKDGFNKYIKQVGQSVCFSGCSETKQERKLELLSDETKILYFLSETDDPGESNDAIYLAIADIIDFHNAFLKEAKEVAMKSGLEHYFPEQEIHFINPAEVHQDICIVSRKSTKEDNTDEKVTERFLLDLVRSRLLYPSETSLFGSSTLETEFKCDILHLQEDICRSFLVGKPFIRNLEQFRTNFKFTASKREALELGISTDDLQKHLDERLKVPLRSQQIQELEYGFHSANCQLLVDVTTGIYGVANQLLLKFNPFRVEHLQDMTLPEFIRQTRTKRITMQPEVLVSGLVVHHERLSSVQIDCLNNLKMSSLYSSLELFLEWISDGLYDFNHLPYKMKSNLPNECKELLSTPHLHQIYKGDVAEILSDINSFVTVLIHSETHMARSISDCAQISLIEYLSDSSLCLFGDDRSALVKMILPSVLCRHYVKLRVHLRKIEQELTANIDSEEAGAPSEKWNELVHDLWEEKYLKYLWELAVDFEEVDTFVYDPYTGTYGFEEWDRQSEEDKYITPQETQKVCAITVIDQEITSEPPTVPREQLDTIIQHVAKTIDSDGIGEFLNKYDDLKEYKELFKAQEIDGEILIALTKEELKDMGIPNSWHQTKILLEFKKFCKTKQDTAKTVHE